MSPQFIRDFAPWAAGLFAGVGLGGILTSLAGSVGASVSALCLVIGAAFFLAWRIRWGKDDAFRKEDEAKREADEEYLKTDALDVVFEGEGTPCTYEYTVPEVTTITVPFTGSVSYNYPPKQISATGTRLHVKNLRDRRVKQVTVRILDARVVEDGARAYPYSDMLKWMHDDLGARQRSLEGRTVEAGNDAHAYIDLATKGHPYNAFSLEFAQPHLRQIPLPAVPTYVLIEAMGADERTGERVPPCQRAFLIDIRKDGGLTVTLKTLGECGFTS